MAKPVISISTLLRPEGHAVTDIVAALETSQDASPQLWTDCLPSSTKGGKDPCNGALLHVVAPEASS